MQKKTYKMTSKTEFIGIFCCVDSLNDRKQQKCSYKRIKNTTIYRYHVAINNQQMIQSKQQQQQQQQQQQKQQQKKKKKKKKKRQKKKKKKE